jgi:pyridoxamine 5'-phosphate oxidase
LFRFFETFIFSFVPLKNAMLQSQILQLRKEYAQASLEITDVSENPIHQFKSWFDQAMKSGIIEPYAMNISTVDSENRPSSRIVLLRDVNENGFVFYTNYLSRKGKEINEKNFGAINFFWPELERQIRIEGELEKVSTKVSDDYFALRPRGSQIGAWASPQSSKIESREILEKNEKDFTEKFQNQAVPRPEHWGGYLLKPDYFEFWQGRENRLHDRISYEKMNKIWELARLAP